MKPCWKQLIKSSKWSLSKAEEWDGSIILNIKFIRLFMHRHNVRTLPVVRKNAKAEWPIKKLSQWWCNLLCSFFECGLVGVVEVYSELPRLLRKCQTESVVWTRRRKKRQGQMLFQFSAVEDRPKVVIKNFWGSSRSGWGANLRLSTVPINLSKWYGIWNSRLSAAKFKYQPQSLWVWQKVIFKGVKEICSANINHLFNVDSHFFEFDFQRVIWKSLQLLTYGCFFSRIAWIMPPSIHGGEFQHLIF